MDSPKRRPRHFRQATADQYFVHVGWGLAGRVRATIRDRRLRTGP
ncbi:hypothetical protein [Streptosporangium sp. NPDC050284]